MSKKKNKSETYVNAYNESQYAADEKNFEKSIKAKKIDWGSFQRLLTRDLCIHSTVLENGYIGESSLSDITDALEHPKHGWKTLQKLSDELMRISPHYCRLNNTYSNMALFCWGIDLFDIKENVNTDIIKKAYISLAAKLETMHIKHEFSKIMKLIPYKDLYCGLVVESSTDFFFQNIDVNICNIYQIQDGLYNFRINLSKIHPQDIDAYPDYVQKEYVDYLHNVKNGQNCSVWYTPPAEKQICIKLNYQWTYPYPILIGMIKDLLNLDVYKKLKLQSAKTDNYKAILIKVPIDENQVDKPLLTPETLSIFADINRENMNDDIGMLYTLGSNGEAISFKDSSNTRNNVSDAIDEVYNSSGMSKELFNGSSSGTALTFSIENDAGYIYTLYRQLERWMNRYIKLKKYNKNTFKFMFYLLDVTIFNRDTVSKRYKDACSLGATVVDKWLATLDMTPSRTMGSFILHENIFDFQNKFKPLQSSYNNSSDAGRPTNAENGKLLSDEGQKTADGEKNDS